MGPGQMTEREGWRLKVTLCCVQVLLGSLLQSRQHSGAQRCAAVRSALEASAAFSEDLVPQVSAVPRVPSRGGMSLVT